MASLGRSVGANRDNALHAGSDHMRSRPPTFQRNFNAQLISRDDRASKSGALNAGEHNELPAAVVNFC